MEFPPRKPSPPPPGQRVVPLLPVQHIGELPDLRAERFRLELGGAVAAPRAFALAELEKLATTQLEADFHAGTGWSVLGLRWRGVRLADLLALAQPQSDARFVRFSDGGLYDASLTLAEALAPDVLVATQLGGEPLTPEHGAPVRLVAPAKYGYKSVKWLRNIEVRRDDGQGFWERRGAHPGADPWREERFA
jgi:DMSO/TMAO reductase YedYZ molybdopterin-dependent catalytic subunit